jgi:hypothetical protein
MKILKARERNIHYDGNGEKSLRIVMGKRFKKNGYTHIQLAGRVVSASVVSGIVWLNPNP